jgi:HlyD family secretion protein
MKENYTRAGIRWIAGSAVLSALAGLGYWGYLQVAPKQEGAIAVQLIPVERGDVEITITEGGTIELGGQRTFKAPRDLTVEQVLVKERQQVSAGTTLLVLRDRDSQQNYQDQRIEQQKNEDSVQRRQEVVQEKRRKLQENETRYRQQQADFQQGRSPEFEKLRAAEKRLKESQELLDRGIISDDDFQSDTDRVSDAQAKIRELADQLRGERDKVDEARSQFKEAELELRKVNLDNQRSREKVKELQQRLGDSLLRAPTDSIVLKIEVKPGDGVKTEGRLLTLGDPNQEIVKLQITTLNATKVRINQKARISLIGPNPKVFTGRITSLSPQATADFEGGGGRSNSGQAKVDARIQLDQPSKIFIPGGQVSVEVILDQRKQVLTVPLEVVQTEESSFVWVRDEQGRAQKREITLGLQGLTTAEVKSGLKAGEKVVQTAPDQVLKVGMPLKIEDQPTPPIAPAPEAVK